jgi:hypothetical protein
VWFACRMENTIETPASMSGEPAVDLQATGEVLWYPTSREKRARYGAPGICGWGGGSGGALVTIGLSQAGV